MIDKVIAKLQQAKFKYKKGKEQKLLDRFVTIHADKINKPAYDEMRDAQKVMTNYVMNRGVGVDIYDAGEAIANGMATKPHIGKQTEGNLLVKVTNLLNGMIDEKIISADTKKVHRAEQNNFIVFDIKSEDLQYSRKTKKSYEDTFLRNLYRNIQEMTEKVTK